MCLKYSCNENGRETVFEKMVQSHCRDVYVKHAWCNPLWSQIKFFEIVHTHPQAAPV